MLAITVIIFFNKCALFCLFSFVLYCFLLSAEEGDKGTRVKLVKALRSFSTGRSKTVLLLQVFVHVSVV